MSSLSVRAVQISTLGIVRGADAQPLADALEEAVQFSLLPHGEDGKSERWAQTEHGVLLLPSPAALHAAWPQGECGSCSAPPRKEVQVSVRVTLFPSLLHAMPAEATKAVLSALSAHKAATGYEPDEVVLNPLGWVSDALLRDAGDTIAPAWSALVEAAHSCRVGIEVSTHAQLEALFPLATHLPRPSFVSLSTQRGFCTIDERIRLWCTERGLGLELAPTPCKADDVAHALSQATARASEILTPALQLPSSAPAVQWAIEHTALVSTRGLLHSQGAVVHGSWV